MEHVVRQARLELVMPGESIAAMEACRRFFETRVQAELGEVLDSLSLSDQQLYVERLEIDLGAIDFDSPAGDWQERLRRAVSAALPVLPQSSSDNRRIGDGATGADARTAFGGSFAAILHYLLFGVLPWYERRSFRQLEEAFRQPQDIADELVSSSRIDMIGRILSGDTSRTRLLMSLQPATRTRVISTYLEARLAAVEGFAGTRLDVPALVDQLLGLALEQGREHERLAGLADAELWNSAGSSLSGIVETSTGNPELLPELLRARKPLEQPKPPDAEVDPLPTGNKAEVIYVENAGIALLAVYLPALFSKLGLLGADRRFIDDNAVENAVHLVHFLATGETRPHESELALPKILCGLEVSDSLGNEITLPGAFTLEAEALIESAISNWPAIGKTSKQGFRQTFLQREGRLEYEKNGWHLIVEQRGVDILLSSLPWAYHTIRLPWLELSLQVDWA